MAGISADVMLKTIVGHFLGDRDTYMTTELSGINGCIPDRVMVSNYGSSPCRGNFRLSKDYELLPETSESMIYTVIIRLMLKRLAQFQALA